MPIYESGKCSKETEKIIQDHFKTCKNCKEIFDDMHKEVGLKDTFDLLSHPPQDERYIDTEFWSKYYGNLIIKGIGIFSLVYVIALILKLYLK